MLSVVRLHTDVATQECSHSSKKASNILSPLARCIFMCLKLAKVFSREIVTQ